VLPRPEEIPLRCITILIQLLDYEFSMTKLELAQGFLLQNYHDHASLLSGSTRVIL
jgi:hypothetical protein